MTVAAGDAHPFPIYGGRYRFGFVLFDADGDPVTGATSPDSERSIDFATFADCSNEATEIATSSGSYYLDMIYSEMQATCTMVQIKSGNAKTAVHALYPVRLPVLRSFTAAAGGGSTITLDSGASAKDGAYVGLYVQCTNNSPANVQGQTRKIISYVGSTKVATVAAAWGTNPSSATTADLLIPQTVNVHAWAGQEPAEWATAGVPKVDIANFGGSAGTFSSGRPEVNTTHFNGTAATASGGRPEVNTTHAAGTAWGSGAITAAVFASDAITAAKLHSDVTTELQSGLATASALSSVASAITTIDGIVDDILTDTGTTLPATLSTIAGYLDTEVAAILAAVDTEVGAIKTVTDGLNAQLTTIDSNVDAILVDTGTDIPAAFDALPTAAENATAVMASTIEGSLDLTEMQRLFAAALLGKASGLATTTAVFRDTGDSKDRITATVDADGNRSAVTLDAS